MVPALFMGMLWAPAITCLTMYQGPGAATGEKTYGVFYGTFWENLLGEAMIENCCFRCNSLT